MKKKIIEAMQWCLMAFLVGACVALGDKAVDRIWPDQPTVMEHVVVE